jgi:hypothetical protein
MVRVVLTYGPTSSRLRADLSRSELSAGRVPCFGVILFKYHRFCFINLKLIDSNIGCLLFADDLLILSETKKGLQHSLNNLSNYCDNWQLAINVNKTKSE